MTTAGLHDMMMIYDTSSMLYHACFITHDVTRIDNGMLSPRAQGVPFPAPVTTVVYTRPYIDTKQRHFV